MKKNDIHRIFEQTDCLSRHNMLAYLEGKFSANEQYQFEKHLNSCSICRDEFEGLLAMQDHKKLPLIVSELNQRVDKYALHSSKNLFFKSLHPFRIAAVVLILIGSGFFINYYLQYSSQDYYDSKMVSQNIEEPASDEAEILEDGITAPVTEEIKPEIEKKIESAKDNNRSDLVKERDIQSSEEKADKISALSDVLNDEKADFESDKDIKISISNYKTKSKDEPVEESRGKRVSDDKKVITEELDEDELEKEEEISYGEISKNNQRKLDNNFNRAKLLANKKGKTKGYLVSYQQAGIDAYYDGNYQEATVALNNSVKYEGKTDKTLFYLGQTYSAQGDSKKALLNLNKLVKNKESQYQNKAMWEKALLLIRIGKRKSAINVLNDLVKVNSPFKNGAQKKLDSLLTN